MSGQKRAKNSARLKSCKKSLPGSKLAKTVPGSKLEKITARLEVGRKQCQARSWQKTVPGPKVGRVRVGDFTNNTNCDVNTFLYAYSIPSEKSYCTQFPLFFRLLIFLQFAPGIFMNPDKDFTVTYLNFRHLKIQKN